MINSVLAEEMQHHRAEEIARAYQHWNDENEAIAASTRPLSVKRLAETCCEQLLTANQADLREPS